jgi:hypothetical protein
MKDLSLESTLARLQALHRVGRAAVEVEVDGVRDAYEVMLFPPAREGEIALAVAGLGRTVPEPLVNFWRFSNGANLFVNDSGLHGVGVASTGRIGELHRDEEEIYGAAALAPYVVFARVNGGGDFLVLELATGRVLDGVHAEQPGEWNAIAESFGEWLARFVAGNGRYYWLEALYEAPQA